MISLLIAMTILLNPSCDSCSCSGLGRAYVGGSFTTIGGATETRCAMLDRLGLAVPTFTCSIDTPPNVFYLDEPNEMLWIGGDFTTINGGAQVALVAVNWNTGVVVYAPTLTGNFSGTTTVTGLYADIANNRLYINGDFTNVNGTVCTGAVRLSLGATPAMDTAWLPVLDGASSHTGVLGSTVYLTGGGFTLLNGAARAGAGAVDDAVGTVNAAWNPKAPAGGVEALLIRSTTSIFITGNFLRLNGATGPFRRGLAEVDGTAGTCTSWDPAPSANILTNAGTNIVSVSGILFACSGNFTASAGGLGPRSVAVFYDAGAIDQVFQPVLVAGQCNSAHLGSNGRLYACMGGGGDTGVFALSTVDGSTFQDWLPAANAACSCITTSPTPP